MSWNIECLLNNQFIDPSKCLRHDARCSFVGFKSYNQVHYIANLTSHDLVMEIVQNSLNHNSYISHTNIVHWKHIWDMSLLEDVKFMWHSFIHRFILHSSIHLSMCQTCFQHMTFACKMYKTYEWTNFARFSLVFCHMLNLWCIPSS
jgi:hypothetical protein